MVLLSLALLLAADPAVTAAPQAEKPKLICKSIGLTGTRLGGGKRECRTKEGWTAYLRQSEADAREIVDSTNVRFSSQ